MRRRHPWWLLFLGLGLVLGVGALTRAAYAAPRESPPKGALVSPGVEPGVGNDYCLGCHAKPDQIKTLPNGESLYLTIDPQLYADSVHGASGYACVQCHIDIRTYPHPEQKAEDRRDVTVIMSGICKRCHIGNYEKTLDSMHEQARERGDKNAAVCADCHNPHTQQRLTNPDTQALLPRARAQIPQTCARCHSAIYDQYKQSVHGAALLELSNPDVPTCITCHGVHNIGDPTTAAFRLDSPQLCAGCHTDTAMMSKYNVSTQVLNTYLADFHGTTITLFQKESPEQVTNKPVCFDCHGIHNIAKPNDPQKGLSVKENLLVTCQKCHPDATANFPDAWLSHYEPSPAQNSLVYYVNLFYKFFIPGVLGGMGVFVLSDIWRRFIQPALKRVKKGARPA